MLCNVTSCTHCCMVQYGTVQCITVQYGTVQSTQCITVQCVADYISHPICHIINSSIRQKTFAMKWKTARVILIQKAKELSRIEPSTFRPISLLPVLSKLVERTVQEQLVNHFESNHLFHPNNHAYRTSRSTTSAMLQLVD